MAYENKKEKIMTFHQEKTYEDKVIKIQNYSTTMMLYLKITNLISYPKI